MRSCKNLLILISIIVLLAGCGPHKLKIKEDAYGTGSEGLARFHRIVEADRGLGLRFPGFLIGIEKAYRDKIGAPEKEDITSLNFNSEKNKQNAKRLLNDPKSSFISHIAQYSLGTVTNEHHSY